MREEIDTMIMRLAHRGPNGSGVFLDGNVGLGHRRLSVIDLEGGSQPMTDGGTQTTIVYNGEFFNFATARAQLIAGGHQMRTHSDTEVLLKIARGDPKGWIDRVNGMFAFALWDARDRSLTLVRDRFGVKPLYYVHTDAGIAFASEIKALLGTSLCPLANPETEALAEYLAFRHVLQPRTLFRGVRQLPGGHYLRVTPGSSRLTIGRYWHEDEALQRHFPDPQDDGGFGEQFAAAVRRRLVADVPLGSFNSGGVDSSLVTRVVRNAVPGELHTFSVGFAEEEYDETPFANEVATRLQTHHHAERVPAASYAEMLPEAIWHHDEPLCHPHSVQIMYLSGVARRFVTVVLTGEGADEVFFGYPRLHIPRVVALTGVAARPIGAMLRSLSAIAGLRRVAKLAEVMQGNVPAAIDGHRFLPLDSLHELCPEMDHLGSRPQAWADTPSSQGIVERLLEYERRSYMQSLLVRLDKMTMARGLEARTPFLDFELVLWSKQLRAGAKTGKAFSNKQLLKAEASRHFSTGLVQRRKSGFGVPLRDWFRTQPALRDLLSDLARPGSFVGSFCSPAVLVRLVEEHASGRQDHSEALWVLLNLEVWSKRMLSHDTLA